MISHYEVKLEQFTGPLDKLLQLIEEKHLDVTEVSLAEVTADFINYIQSLGQKAEPRILADFLAVAAQLVLIKSKVLLPSLELTQEEEIDIHQFEARLKLYQEFKQAAARIFNLWNRKHIALSRPLFFALGDRAIFYPPKKLAVNDFAEALNKLLATLKEFLPEATQKIKQRVITLESKINELANRLQEAAEQSFKSLSQSQSREEIVVLFLALLHLLRDRLINVEQKGQFSDIILRKLGNSKQ